MSARLNGTLWLSDPLASNPIGAVAVRRGTILEISGHSLASYVVQLYLQDCTGPGTYELQRAPTVRYGLVARGVTGWGAHYGGSDGSGSLTVTELSQSRVRGTFAFTAVQVTGIPGAGPMVVTEGEFDIAIR
jgi:hypothetical protein